MKLSEIQRALTQIDRLKFYLPSGASVPSHFHITEIGAIERSFIDCGGTIRKESVINFQLFTAQDFNHRLGVSKLQSIISLSIEKLGLDDLDVEVEYQSDTIGKYGLEFDGEHFHLTAKQTDCLAKDKCGIPHQKPRIRLSSLTEKANQSCTPESGCC